MDRFRRGEAAAFSEAAPTRPLRVGYVSGPSDADGIYEDLRSNRPRTYFGTNYMRQFLLLMDELGADALIETWHGAAKYRRKIGRHVFNNVPQHARRGSLYHLQNILHMTGVLWRQLLFQPDVIVLTGKQEYWWVLAPLRLTRTRFIASLHSVIWPPFLRLKRHYEALLFLNQHLILRHLDAVVATSKRIADQFAELAGDSGIPLFDHLPTWDRQQFEGVTPADRLPPSPFAVMFTGRIERDKGIYDLVEIAAQLNRERPGEFIFHVCGDGTELERVRRLIEDERLNDVVLLHGYCAPDRMKAVMSTCHAAIVPTRTDCPAGFEMTCAEAILCGRPLVTSAVAPAIDYLRPASIEVPPEDVPAYKRAIVKLKDDPVLYREKREACAGLREQFFSYENSWDFAMREAFATLSPRQLQSTPVTPR